MRDRGPLVSGLVLLMLVCACGKQGETPAEPPADQVIEATPPPREAAPPPATGPLSRSDVRSGLRDLADVLAKADAKRVAVGGGHGLQLGKVDPASFLTKLGLRNGDVLQK